MLEAVGHPHAVNPDRALRKEAVARDWPVLVFTRAGATARPVAGVTPAEAEHLAAAAVGAGAATAGVVWLASRGAGRGPSTRRRVAARATRAQGLPRR